MDDNDPLSKFTANDVKATDRQKLADFLTPFLEKIDPATGEVSFLSAFHELTSNGSKVQIVLVAAKARSLLSNVPDGMTPKELIALEVIPEGSVKTALKTLLASKQIKQDGEGRYYIPNYRISDLVSKLNKDKKSI